MTVGASTDDGVTALVAQLHKPGADAQQIEMRLLEGSVPLASPAVEAEYVDCGTGAKASDFPKGVAGKIALIQRGDISFRDKAANAQQAGAVAAVIYNNRDGNFFGSMGDDANKPSIPAVSVSKADGELMLKAKSEGAQNGATTLRLTPDQVAQPDRLAEFSSRGPNNDNWIKPELCAPGVNIYSATITQAGQPGGGMPDPSGYVVASGTSMATPHVAGAAALIRQAHPDWTSIQIKAALVNTARWMPNQGTVMDQGNGAIDLARAIDCRAILVTAADPVAPTYSFGEVANAGKQVTSTQSLTIKHLNADAAKDTYKLSVEIVGQPKGMTASLSAGSINCSGAECVAAFDLTIQADGAQLADGEYYGFVRAEADWGTLRLPFYYAAAQQPSAKPPAPGGEGEQPVPSTPGHRVGGMPCC